MSDDLINEFQEVRECDYKGEHYSVRDNGAIMRHPSKDGRSRALDGKWTFGKKDEKTGYMNFASNVRVHIVVATAFYGAHDSTKLVVDHIDTNRCNNRAQNLRWLTRLENALNNPVTRKRIEWLCGGDISKFINNPSCLRTDPKYADVAWMRTVSSEEARTAYENVMHWAQAAPKVDTERKSKITAGSHDKRWIFEDSKGTIAQPGIVSAKSPLSAVQLKWTRPAEFVKCPTLVSESGLCEYAERLKPGEVFARNPYGESLVVEAELSMDKTFIVVRTENTTNKVKSGGAVAKIFIKDGRYVHESLGTFFLEDGAKKTYTLALGREWTGGVVFDDFC